MISFSRKQISFSGNSACISCARITSSLCLVGLFHNLRLMARMNKTAYTEPAVGWLEDYT